MVAIKRPRRRGEGSIVWREDRRRFMAQTPRLTDGKRLYAYFETEQEAHEWLDRQVGRLRRGVDLTRSREQLGPFLLRWLDLIHPLVDGRESSTRKTYRARIYHVDSVDGLPTLPLCDLRADHFQALVAKMAAMKLAERTIRHTIGTLHQALAQAVEWKQIAENPVVVRINRGEPPPDQAVWSLDDVNEFLSWSKAQGDPLYPAWRLGFTLGPRISQILGLQWGEDIDFERRRISLGSALSMRGKRRQANKSKRRHWVDAPLPVLAALGELERRGPWVFAKSPLVPWGPCYVRKQFEDRVRRFRYLRAERMKTERGLEQVPVITPHGMRHTAATIMLENGWSFAEVAQVLGHHSPVVTAKMYAHVTPKRPRESAERMAGLIP